MDGNKGKNKSTEVIDLRVIFRKIVKRKTLFYKVLPIVFVLSCAYILCIPRYYTTSLSLAPETVNSPSMSGSLGALASSFGFDLGSMQSNDAIYPLLYPDLMEDNAFVADILSVKVESADGEFECTYKDYLDMHQKSAWWKGVFRSIGKLFPKKEEEIPIRIKNRENPYILSRRQEDIFNTAKENIGIDIDKKTNVIGISVTAQDPLICKTMTDSVKERLQDYVTKYRTNKARIDEAYYERLAAEAKKEYEKARNLYGTFADANTDLSLQSLRSKQNDLENDMQLKYNTYSAMVTQYQAAKAKVQERTPAFTVIKGAAVPIKPIGPKRMLFVIGMMILAFFITIIYIVKDDIKRFMNPENQ